MRIIQPANKTDITGCAKFLIVRKYNFLTYKLDNFNKNCPQFGKDIINYRVGVNVSDALPLKADAIAIKT